MSSHLKPKECYKQWKNCLVDSSNHVFDLILNILLINVLFDDIQRFDNTTRQLTTLKIKRNIGEKE